MVTLFGSHGCYNLCENNVVKICGGHGCCLVDVRVLCSLYVAGMAAASDVHIVWYTW